uniref:Nuclear factor-Y subunit B n=2 Tax=Schmidtea mediterranea TaxID=79327 RepID=A0A172G7H7_SCHMD|nr:nuclear factor-Y subunit B [Schmidtea mediterranea]
MDDNMNTFLEPLCSASYKACDIDGNDCLKDQDRFLPICNVSKIMKKDLPFSAKIAKDAKQCVQECASEFISFVSSEAAEICQNDKRKTINGEDILQAFANLGFDNYVETLQNFLQTYREANKFENDIIDLGNNNNAQGRPWSMAPVNSNSSSELNIKLNMPHLLSMLPLTDLTSSNLNLENLLRDSDFQRAVLNHLKKSSTDEDSFNMDEAL